MSENKEDSVTGSILRWGAKKRSRIRADSSIGFGRYAAKMALSLVFVVLDGIFIPSGFEALGILTVNYVVLIAIVLTVAASVELKILSLIR